MAAKFSQKREILSISAVKGAQETIIRLLFLANNKAFCLQIVLVAIFGGEPAHMQNVHMYCLPLFSIVNLLKSRHRSFFLLESSFQRLSGLKI